MSVLLSLLSALCLCGYNSSFCNCTSLKLYVCGCKSVCTYDICSFFCSDSKESPSTALGVVCGTFCVASSVFFFYLWVWRAVGWGLMKCSRRCLKHRLVDLNGCVCRHHTCWFYVYVSNRQHCSVPKKTAKCFCSFFTLVAKWCDKRFLSYVLLKAPCKQRKLLRDHSFLELRFITHSDQNMWYWKQLFAGWLKNFYFEKNLLINSHCAVLSVMKKEKMDDTGSESVPVFVIWSTRSDVANKL